MTSRRIAPGGEGQVLSRLLGEGRWVRLLQVVDDPEGSAVGLRLVLSSAGLEGTLGEPRLDAAAGGFLETEPASGLHTLESEGGRPLAVYVESFFPVPHLVIVGAGHISRPLARVGHLLGFRVVVLDDRPDFAQSRFFPEAEQVSLVDFSDPFRDVRLGAASHLVLVTRGHKYDYECLRRVLLADEAPAYVGMIGSRRRVRATWVQLEREGIPRDKIARVRAPIGLDLGAETPEEIAIAVAAELVLLRRGGTGVPLREKERVLERFLGEEEAHER